MIVFEFGNILCRDIVSVECNTILFVWHGTNLLKSSNYSCPLITDVITQEVNIQRGTSHKLLVGIHQRTTFQIEVTAIFCLRHSVKQSLLKVSCENGLIKHILFLGNVQQFAADRLAVIHYVVLAHSFTCRYRSRMVPTRSFRA